MSSRLQFLMCCAACLLPAHGLAARAPGVQGSGVQGSGVQGPAAATVRLVDRVEAPMLYLALEGRALEGRALEGRAAEGRATDGATSGVEAEADAGREATANPDATAAGAVHRLLADPAFDVLLGAPGGAAGADSSSTALALVRGVLARSAGEVELALTGVVPQSGQPLLVLRARLQEAEAGRLAELLAGPDLAVPERTIGATQTYSLRGTDASAGSSSAKSGVGGVGRRMELAVLGRDLFVANDGTAMEELLTPLPKETTAAAPRRVLSADPRFTGLRKQLVAGPGSLLVYGDWQRLSRRLQASDEGVPQALLAWSGLGNARSVMASLAGEGANFSGTLLLDFEVAAGGAGQAGAAADAQIDGWFAATQSVPAKSLLGTLPSGGLGGLVVAVDLAEVAQGSPRGARMLHEIDRAFARFGLDFERKVLGRLGTGGTVQLLFREVGGVPEIVSVYALRAKSRKAAEDLFVDLRRAAESRGIGKLLLGQGRNGIEVLTLQQGHWRGRAADADPVEGGDADVCVAVFEDMVLVGADVPTLVLVHDEYRRSLRTRGKRDAAVAKVVAAIGGDKVSGLFDLDLGPFFERLSAALTERGAPGVDLSTIPQRHTGYLDVQSRDGGAVLRIRVLSAR